MSYVEPTKKPCSDCPFRRKAMPGWLGGGSPESFIDCMQRDEPLPCHQTIDYDDPHWLVKWMSQEHIDGKICAGSLIFMANKMQRPHDKTFPTMDKDTENVFSNSVEFVRHHREAGTRSWDDDDQNDGAQFQRELISHSANAMKQPIIDFRNKKTKPKRNVPLHNITTKRSKSR